MTSKKPRIGFFGISGCGGCLLTVLYENNFKSITKLLDIKSFPFIKEDTYKGKLDYAFIEGTVCFNDDIKVLKELRKRSKKIVALGSCACFGCVPSMKNFHDKEKIMKFVYPRHNRLKSIDPTPISDHIKVDFSIPQCPPNKDEILKFIKCITAKKEFKTYTKPVCFECRKAGISCLLKQGRMCLGPITTGGCGALCPANDTMCYGCRGPTQAKDFESFFKMIKNMGYSALDIKDKIETFAGLKFKERICNG